MQPSTSCKSFAQELKKIQDLDDEILHLLNSAVAGALDADKTKKDLATTRHNFHIQAEELRKKLENHLKRYPENRESRILGYPETRDELISVINELEELVKSNNPDCNEIRPFDY